VVRRATVPEDRLFLFFATHGMTVPLPGGGEEGYLLFHDTDPTDLPYTALSMSALRQIGQRIPARHILVAVDACYGGYSLIRAQVPPVLDRRYLELLAQSRVIQVLTAGRKNQPVLEEQGHGVFTRKLLDGLRGHADTNGDGIITGIELAGWMHERVAQASDHKQDMQYGSLDGEGQFFFLLPPAAPPPPAPALPPNQEGAQQADMPGIRRAIARLSVGQDELRIQIHLFQGNLQEIQHRLRRGTDGSDRSSDTEEAVKLAIQSLRSGVSPPLLLAELKRQVPQLVKKLQQLEVDIQDTKSRLMSMPPGDERKEQERGLARRHGIQNEIKQQMQQYQRDLQETLDLEARSTPSR
jgi:hypothetical protein